MTSARSGPRWKWAPRRAGGSRRAPRASPLSRPPAALLPGRSAAAGHRARPRRRRRPGAAFPANCHPGILGARNFLRRNPQPSETRAASALREAGNFAFRICERGGCIPLQQINELYMKPSVLADACRKRPACYLAVRINLREQTETREEEHQN